MRQMSAYQTNPSELHLKLARVGVNVSRLSLDSLLDRMHPMYLLQSVREQIKRMAIGGTASSAQDFYAVSSSDSSSSSSQGRQSNLRGSLSG